MTTQALLVLLALAQGVGQRGTEFSVVVPQEVVEEVLFYTPGVVCTRIDKSAGGSTLHLRAGGDCRLGEYAYRLRTQAGFSSLRTVRITPLPIVRSVEEDHSTPATAQLVPLNVSVCGTLEADGQVCYAVQLKRGQRLAAEVEGIRLGLGRTDLALQVHGPDGKLLASADDTPLFRQDPFLTLLAPADAKYTITLQHSGGTGDESPYVLHLGDFPRPQAIFPVGGQAGKSVQVQWLGDAGGDQTQEVALPTTASPNWEFFPRQGNRQAPTPHPFRVSAFPDLTEKEPSDDPAKALRAEQWPVAFNGKIDAPGQRDHFRFPAKKGERIELQVFASRMGSSLDSLISVYGPGGELLGSNDDDETHDSRLLLTVRSDGEHLVRITDKRNAGGPLFFYRLEVDHPKAELTVFRPEPTRKSSSIDTIAVPRGNRVLTYLAVQRKYVEGPVTLTAEELPDGVQIHPVRIPTGEYLVPVVVEARADAPSTGRLARIHGRCGEVSGHFAQVVDLVRGPGDSALHSLTLDRLAVAVTEPVNYRLTVVPPATALCANGSLEVRVLVQRDAGERSAIDVLLPALPEGVEGPIKVTVPADKEEAVFPLVAKERLPAGKWPLIAVGQPAQSETRGDRTLGRRSRRSGSASAVASAAEMLLLSPPQIRGQIATVVGEPGKSTQVVCTLEATEPLPGPMTATLDGLPPRASASSVTLQPSDRKANFTITLADTTPPGTYSTLSVLLSGSVNGQKVSYRIAQGGTVLAGLKTGKDGKPLSPLEALRKSQK